MRLRLLAAALAAATSLAGNAHAGPRYQLVDLGTLGGETSAATAVSDGGVVVGVAQRPDGGHRAFRWQRGQLTALDSLGPNQPAAAADVNAGGTVVGASPPPDSLIYQHAVRWSPGIEDLGVLGTPDCSQENCEREGGSEAFGVNLAGEIVGMTTKDGSDGDFFPFVHRGSFIELAGGPGVANAITDAGVIVGRSGGHAARWPSSTSPAQDLGTLGGARSTAFDVSASGVVVGESLIDAQRTRAFRWTPEGGMQSLGTLGALSSALAVNASGVIVGSSNADATGQTTQPRAFRWEDGTLVDLNTEIPPNTGWVLESARDVNAMGWIVGRGTKDGRARAFLLRPAQLTVTDAGDGPDASPGDGGCSTQVDVCTLRAAIMEARALPGEDEITFAIPGADTPVISPTSPLPALTDPVRLDARSQPGGLVQLDGLDAGGDGLVLEGGRSTVRGMVVSRFAGNGIVLRGGDGNTVEGSVLSANGGSGVLIAAGSDGNVIGAPPGASDPAADRDRVNRLTANRRSGVAVADGTRNFLPRNVFSGNVLLAIDLGDDGPSANDAGDADAGPNGRLNRLTPWVAQIADRGAAAWGLAPVAPRQTLTSYTLHSASCRADGRGEGAPLGEGFRLSAAPDDLQQPFTGSPTLVTADAQGRAFVEVSGDGPVLSVALVDADGNTSELSDCSVDTDQDGLQDAWETAGADLDGTGSIDLPLQRMGANPRRKDIFVEADAMTGHRLTAAAIERVTKAFGDAGIALHVDNGPGSTLGPDGGTWGALSRSNDLPHQRVLMREDAGGEEDWSAFLAIKDRYFELERRAAFHYLVLAHDLLAPDGDTLGISRGIPGADIVLGLASTCPDLTDCPGDLHFQSVSFMHELGHNLGLEHGGNTSELFKPNYPSIMNYSYAATELTFERARGRTARTFIDYSRVGSVSEPGPWGSLVSLTESQLDENRGLSAQGRARSLEVVWLCPGRSQPNALGTGPMGAAALDWNCNRSTGGIVDADLTYDGQKRALHPFSDWPALRLADGLTRNARFAAPPQRRAQRLSFAMLRRIARAATGDRVRPRLRARRRKRSVTLTATDARALDSVVVTLDGVPTTYAAQGRRRRAVTLRLKRGRHKLLAYASDRAANTSKAIKLRVRTR